MNQYEMGRRAEHLAALYLRARGYRIWKTNWRWGRKELDLVTLYREQLVVVEVKAMDGNTVNDPLYVVDARKQRNIIAATEAFIRIHDCRRPTRFDVVSVSWAGGTLGIEHIENAFLPVVE